MNIEQQIEELKQSLGDANNLLIATNLDNAASKEENVLYFIITPIKI